MVSTTLTAEAKHHLWKISWCLMRKKTLFSCLNPALVQMNRWKLLFSFLTASELLTAKVRTDVNVSKFSSLKPISNLILESFVVCSFAQMFFLHFTNTNCLKVPEMFPTISIHSVPTGHLLQFLNLSGSPLVCHPGAVKPSLYSLNHCLCQLTSCGKESSSNRQMKGHHHCPDANCFYQPTKCGCLAVTTGFSQQVCFPVVLIF